MSAFIGPLIFAVVFLLGACIDWIRRRNRRIILSAEQGSTRYPGMYLSTGIAALVGAVVLATLVTTQGDVRADWFIFFLFSLVLVGVGAHSIRAWLVNKWEWDTAGITHVSGKRVTRIAWADISSGKWLIGGWRITGPNGSISCWQHVIGYDLMSETLIRHRPDFAHITSLRA